MEQDTVFNLQQSCRKEEKGVAAHNELLQRRSRKRGGMGAKKIPGCTRRESPFQK